MSPEEMIERWRGQHDRGAFDEVCGSELDLEPEECVAELQAALKAAREEGRREGIEEAAKVCDDTSGLYKVRSLLARARGDAHPGEKSAELWFASGAVAIVEEKILALTVDRGPLRALLTSMQTMAEDIMAERERRNRVGADDCYTDNARSREREWKLVEGLIALAAKEDQHG